MNRVEWRETRNRGRLKRLVPFFLLSVLVLTLLLPLVGWLLPNPDEVRERTAVALRTIDENQWHENLKVFKDQSEKARKKLAEKKPPEKKKEKEKPKRPDGQVVDIAMPEKEKRPDEAKYVSQYDSKVKKEQKAKKRAPFKTVAPKHSKNGIKQPQQQVGHKPDKLVLNPDMKKPEDPGSQPATDNRLLVPKLKLAMKLDLPEDMQNGNYRNREEQKKDVEGNADRLLMKIRREEQGKEGERGVGEPMNVPRSLLPDKESVENIAGGPMNDYLKDVKQEGDETWLNTRAFKYAFFFNRVKREVARAWKPVEAQRRYDPRYNIYGYRSRYTVIGITLDSTGNLKQAQINRSCGVDFLDQEALSAVYRAAPFPNPPNGIIENGRVEFPFGFYFEMTRSGMPGMQSPF